MFQRRVLKIFKILIKCFIISSCICNSTTEKSCYCDCICQSTQQYAITLGFKRFHCQNCSRPEEIIFSCTVFWINQSINIRLLVYLSETATINNDTRCENICEN